MVANISVNITMIISMDRVSSCGQMERDMKENGARAFSMAKECYAFLMAQKLKVGGRKAREYLKANYRRSARRD